MSTEIVRVVQRNFPKLAGIPFWKIKLTPGIWKLPIGSSITVNNGVIYRVDQERLKISLKVEDPPCSIVVPGFGKLTLKKSGQ